MPIDRACFHPESITRVAAEEQARLLPEHDVAGQGMLKAMGRRDEAGRAQRLRGPGLPVLEIESRA